MFSRPYYPALRTRKAELLALENLSDGRKDQITPLLTFGCMQKNLPSMRSTIDAINASIGDRTFICDLTHDLEHISEEMAYLRNPDKNYGAWRDFIRTQENAIPCAINTLSKNPRHFVRQAIKIEQDHGKIAFRIRDLKNEPSLIVNALNAIDDINNALIFIDAGYISNNYADYVLSTISALNELRSQHPKSRICILSSSFPRSVMDYTLDDEKTWGLIPSQEHMFFEDIGGKEVALHGDHGSIHSAIYKEERGGRWTPRIDYPRLNESYFERRPFDQGAEKPYIEAAHEILEQCPEIQTTTDIWGITKICDAASGKLFARNPSNWIAVRANIHLSKNIDYWNGTSDGKPKNFDSEFRKKSDHDTEDEFEVF